MMRLRSSLMPDLTDDLVEEILARVPATSLKRLRSTCKKWNTLFNDRRFSKKHFDKAEKEYFDMILRGVWLSRMSVNLHELHDNTDPSAIKLKGEFSTTNFQAKSNIYYVSNVFHCSGFLLCTNRSTIVVWNPCTGQTKWILTKSANTWDYRYALGYANKKSGHDYKILSFLIQEPFVCEIFEFNSDSWRVSGSVNPDLLNIGGGVSVKGNTYWMASDKESDNCFLISFDFTTERLRPRGCLPFQGQFDLRMMPLYSVREERLSVLFKNYDASKIEIWMTNDITETNVMSWSNFLRIDLTNQLLNVVSFSIEEENRFAVLSEYKRHDEYSDTLPVYVIGEDRCWKVYLRDERGHVLRPLIFSYVPSLVQI